MSFTITKKGALPEGEFEIEGEIHADIVKGFRETALASISEGIKMDGFRPGHIPEKIVLDRMGEATVNEEAGRLALEKHYDNILADAKISPIGSPSVTITKATPGEAFGFKIKTAVMPVVTLPDYKKIAKKVLSEKTEVEVTEKEIDDSVDELRKQIAHNDHHKAHPDDHGHDHGELPLPEVNDAFIKQFGDFENIDAFRAKISLNIKAEKERKAREILRLKAMEAIIAETDVTIPNILIDSELDKMVSEMTSNIAQMGLNVDTYLKHINKSIDDLRKEWAPDALKRAQTQLILGQIALTEKVKVDEKDIKKEVDQILTYYKDADRMRAEIYVEMMLINEKAWKLLEE